MTTIPRRTFLAASAAALGLSGVDARRRAARGTASHRAHETPAAITRPRGFDPWLEIDAAALRHNAAEVARLAGDRPVLAVIKNNAYGLGLAAVAHALEPVDAIAGFATVKADAAVALRDAGVRKPVLLMGQFDDEVGAELASRDVRLTPYDDGAPERLRALARRLGRRIPVHLYLDTGMGRLGMPFRRAVPWMAALAASDAVTIEGTFMAFTEDDNFDPVQLERLLAVARDARARGIALGRLHAASSHALFFRPPAMLDLVRPGLALYGAYPAGARQESGADLTPAFRLCARAVRVERLEPGDSVSYGRRFVAARPTWVATLPVGHADGYPRRAVEGCEVLIGSRVYPVIGAVSASHTVVELGEERTVEAGDVATLVGPDHPAIHPNAVAARSGISVYDVLMHLSAGLPRFAV